MDGFNPQMFSTPDLFRSYSAILDELKVRGVIRTRNNPGADYAEWLVAKGLGLELMPNSHSGYDAKGPDGERFQIKSRRFGGRSNDWRQLSVIRNLQAREFDYLIGVIFGTDFTIMEAYKIPHGVIDAFSRFSGHQNGHILHLRGAVLEAPSVEDISHVLNEAMRRANNDSL